MWARVIEIMLGCWLAISPFVFRHAPDARFLWFNDFVCAITVISIALVSFNRAVEKVHLLNGFVGLWLVAAAFLFAEHPVPGGFQNLIVTGALLLMLCIVPCRSQQPPRRWTDFVESHQNDRSKQRGETTHPPGRN